MSPEGALAGLLTLAVIVGLIALVEYWAKRDRYDA